jgi:hypothetical protein
MIGLVASNDKNRPHLFEAFLDFHCPFSKKLFATLTSVITEFPNVELRVVVQVFVFMLVVVFVLKTLERCNRGTGKQHI